MDKNVKIIIFDMDGVILDSEPLHEIARQRMFQSLGITPDESFPSPVGNSASGYWRKIMGLFQMEGDPVGLQEEQYRLVAELIVENNVPVSEGFMDVINYAKENDIKVGLASSSTRALVDETLRLLNVTQYFDCVVSGDEIPKKKPAPDIYLRVLELIGVPAECAVAVEDTKSGTIAAKDAGIFCYGYVNPTSGQQDLSNARAIIYNLREIVK